MKRRSLRQQLGLVVLAIGGSLLLATGWLIPKLVTATEDSVFSALLSEWVTAALAQPIEASREPVPLGPGVTLYPSPATVPPSLADWTDRLPVGTYEFNDRPLPGLDATEAFVVILDGEPRRLLVWDVGPYEAFEGPWPLAYAVPIIGGALFACVATLFALRVLTRIARALRELEAVTSVSADELEPPHLPVESRDDEIGAVARAWRASLGRTHAALQRERAFARDASHELRTPLTAARGAVELLEAEEPKSRERHQELCTRALTALDDAERRVATFLWLAREERPTEPEPWGLSELVRELAPDATLDLNDQVETVIAEGAVRVVLTALLGNARTHGMGPLRATLTTETLVLENGLPQRPSSAGGHGFGLSLVHDLCSRIGWQLEAVELDDKFRATIHLQSGSTQ